MTTTELFLALKSLPRSEKLKVMQFLIAELARDEEPSLQSGATYSLWSPLNSHEAAHKLSGMLKADYCQPCDEVTMVAIDKLALPKLCSYSGDF
jgi:hypothetical protein